MRFNREALKAAPNYNKLDKTFLAKANIGQRYWKNNRLHELPSEAKWAVKAGDYVDQMHHLERDGIGLLLIGEYGRGKTTAACRVLMEAMARGPVVVYFVRADDLDWVARHREEETPDGLRKWDLIERDAQFLVIDDLGSERQADWNARWIEHVLSVRYDWQLPTIITSNISLNDLYEQVPRLNHLADSYRIIETDGPNLRTQ